MMMDKMNRRAFLKSAGTVALAVAAAGVLTACGEDAPVRNVEVKAAKVDSKILYYQGSVMETRVYMELDITNKGAVEEKIGKDAFTMELDGKAVNIDSMAFKDSTGYHSTKEIQVKPGETCTVQVIHKLEAKTAEAFEEWGASAHKVTVKAQYNGQSKTFTGDTQTHEVQ